MPGILGRVEDCAVVSHSPAVMIQCVTHGRFAEHRLRRFTARWNSGAVSRPGCTTA